MGELKNNFILDSNLAVTLTVGQLREIIRREIERAQVLNGHEGKKPAGTADPFLTIKEAANLSRLGTSTIRLYIRKRELRACQVGSRVIIKRTDLEQFLEAHPIEIISD